MILDLQNYESIKTHLFVRIEVSYYKASEGSAPVSQILTFSDYNLPYVINGETYLGMGKLMGLSASTSEIRTSSGEFNITLSGIPNSSVYEIVNSRIKGCPVRIYRVLFDPVTNEKIDIPGNPMAKYRGFVNNYSLQEEYDSQSRTSSNSILLVCNSAIDVLQNKVTGRKTNPASQKKFYSSDLCMDRVPTLENATFDFGKPKG